MYELGFCECGRLFSELVMLFGTTCVWLSLHNSIVFFGTLVGVWIEGCGFMPV